MFPKKESSPLPQMAYPLMAVVPADSSQGRLQATMILQTGMTLRDYFAGQVLLSWQLPHLEDRESASQVARLCYQMADAMLAERERRSNENA